MSSITIVYSAMLFAGGAAVLVELARRRAVPWGWALALEALALAGAALFGEGTFGVLRLAAVAVFGLLPLLAFAAAILLRRHARRTAIALGALGAVVTAVGVDAFVIEPRMLEISRVTVTSPKLRRPLRIAVLSDIQMESFGDHERAAIDAVMRERPDLILLPGDYIQLYGPERRAVEEAFSTYLREVGFGAPLGAFAVEGNVDPPEWTAMLLRGGVKVFAATGTVKLEGVAITGLALSDSFDRTIHVPAADRFHIVVGHAPDFALGQVEADLLVAGHTHGGQVRLPFVGPLLTFSHVPRSWAAGVTMLSWHRALVVSRGVGMERGHAPRLRFLCRPEIVVIEAVPAP